MQAEPVETSLSSRVAALPAKVRKQIKAYPAEGQGVNPWIFKTVDGIVLGSPGRLKHLPAICDLKKDYFDGGCGLLYGVSPFRISRLQVLKGRQKEAAWFANVQPLKVTHSDKEGAE